jgi:PAS domain S-box-containing protein
MNSPVKIRLLLIEDNPTDVLLLQTALRDIPTGSVALTHVERLAQGIAQLHDAPFDVVLLDLGLPDSDGLDTLIRLHREFPTIPILVFTGLNDEAVGIKSLQEGAQEYLVKSQMDAPLLGRALRYAMERQRIGTALQESQHNFQQLVECLPQMVWTCNAEGGDIYSSPQWSNYTGSSATEQSAKDFLAQIHPDDQERLSEAWKKSLAEGDDFRVEARIRHRSGCYRWFDMRAVPLRDEAGRTVKWFGTNTEIQEQREIREALRASEEHLRLATEAAQIGTWERDLKTDRLTWSPRQEQMMGYAPGSFPNTFKAFFSLVHPEDQPKLAAAQQTARETGIYKAELRFRLRDGRERWGLLRGQTIYDKEGQPERLIGIDLDITERKQVEVEIVRSRAQLEAVFQSIQDGLVVTDMDGNFRLANEAEARITGFASAAEMLQNLAFYIDKFQLEYPNGEILPVEDWPISRILRGEKITDLELWGRRLDTGQQWFFSYSGEPVLDAEGEPILAVVVTRDITERKQAEKQLRLWADAFENCAHGLAIGDPKTNLILACNPAFAEMEQTPAAEIIGTPILARYSTSEGERVKHQIAEADRTGKTQYQSIMERKDGKRIPVQMDVVTVSDEDGKPLYRVATRQDISARKQAEDELEQSLEQVRSLAMHLQDVREEERKRIARELHDELGQALAGLKYDLAWLETHALSTKSATPQSLKEKTQTMSKLIDSLIQVGRKIATELRPRILDDLGLIAALKWQSREFQSRTGIQCEFIASTEEITLDAERATAAFRISQETLTNILRHAQASAVTIHLQVENDCLRLKIQDNGRGITKRDIIRPGSLGLLGMKERVLPYGGTIDISGRAGKGTSITVILPLTTS